MTMFHVGQMVVCVDDTPVWGGDLFGLARGQVYTIRDLVDWSDFPFCEGIGIRVEEIQCPIEPWGEEGAFDGRRFRPVKRTSIEQLRKLVAPIPTREVENA